MTQQSVLGGLIEELGSQLGEAEGALATGEPGERAPLAGPREAVVRLREDLRSLGFFGLLIAISEAPAPSEEVFRELPAKLTERIRSDLQDAPAGLPLKELFELYCERKGSKGRQVLRKLFENTIFDFFDLREHGLFVDDVSRVLDLFKSAQGEGDDVRTLLKRLAALSSETAKFILGLFPEQIELIYKVSRREAERKEIDAAFDAFAPRVLWKRLFAIAKTLIQKEKRFRLALTLYARLHGVPIGREHVTGIEKHLAIKDTRDLIARALERADARAKLREFFKAHEADLAAMEAIL